MSENSSPYIAFQHPDFRAFLSMRLSLTLAKQIMSIAVSWYVYDLTKDPLMLGFIGLAEAATSIGISLYAGHLADKWNRWKMILGCLFLLLFCSAALVVLASLENQLDTSVLLIGIFSVVALSGLAKGSMNPALFGILPTLVPHRHLANAITWNASSWQVASISGLGLGGLIYGFYGIRATFWVMTVLMVIAVFSHFFIKIRLTPESDLRESALQRIKQGLRFVWKSPLLLGAMALDMFAVLLGGAVALLPIFVDEVLGAGPEALGFLRMAVSIGAIATAFVIAHRRPRKKAGWMLLGTVAGFGLSIIGFGLSTSFWMAFFFLFLTGVFDEVSVFIREALAQFLTPDRMKGRISSINRMFIYSSNEIGTFESGLTAKLMGTVPAIVFGGVMCLVVVVLSAVFSPALRDLDLGEIEDAQKEQEPT